MLNYVGIKLDSSIAYMNLRVFCCTLYCA